METVLYFDYVLECSYITHTRHYHKAVWSERKYQQLLSTSAPAPPPGLAHSATSLASHARRQLSMTFDPATVRGSITSMGSFDTIGGEGEATPTNHRDDYEATPPDPLQNSSDSVFMDNPTQDRLLGNWEQPASPQIHPRGSGRPNPLTSHTSRLHTSSSLEEIPSHYRRRASIPSHTPITSWSVGVGPLSPLAKGHKSRTPSGKCMQGQFTCIESRNVNVVS